MRHAWFTLSHLLLDENARVVNMGCNDGLLTYCMAALAPTLRFIGVDKSKRNITKAKELYESKVHNLEFIHADISTLFAEAESFDAIINSNVLHQVYSGSRYSEKTVRDTLHNHFIMLKEGGTLFIRDFARPPPEEYVLMEMPDIASTGDELKDLSETDLLIWYSEHARPRQDAGCGGFFLEELPPRFPRTRLFRLPYKWAYEFLMRKDDREKWDKDLPTEYTFFTEREFRKELRAQGARVEYSAPYWDDDFVEDHFEGHFRLYRNDGTPYGHPPTCYLAVARKMKERQSLVIGERRPSKAAESSIRISAMRNEATGDILDVVSRAFVPSEVLPYHVNDDGRLKVYLHDGIPRGVANTVPRHGDNIDGRRWSGHMIEALSVDSHIINEIEPDDIKETVKFSRDFLGLKPRGNALLVHGPDYYPAPDYIDERIKTYFLNVERHTKSVRPKNIVNKDERFHAKGDVREFDAQQILNAISVGFIPNARLELQILALFEHLNVRPETWTSKDINIQTQKINKRAETKDLLHKIAERDSRFKEVKGTAGQLRTVNSIFVEEAHIHGSSMGISSDNIDFIVSDEKTINTAVVIPLTKGIQNDLHAGIMVDYFPVPQRHEGNGLTMHAPMFNIPPDITNIKQMKKFIADKFNLKPENVIKLGESYFSHVGLTQHRIYPFAVAAPPQAFAYSKTSFIPFHQYRLLWSSLSKDTHFMVVIARAWQMLSSDIKMDYKMRVKEIVQERFSDKGADWSIPMNYAQPPGRDNRFKSRQLENSAEKEAEFKKAPAQKAMSADKDTNDTSGKGGAAALQLEPEKTPPLAAQAKPLKKLTGDGANPFGKGAKAPATVNADIDVADEAAIASGAPAASAEAEDRLREKRSAREKEERAKKEKESRQRAHNSALSNALSEADRDDAGHDDYDDEFDNEMRELDEIAQAMEDSLHPDEDKPKPEKW